MDPVRLSGLIPCAVAALTLPGLGCGGPAPAPEYPADNPPPSLAGAVSTGDSAIRLLQQRLGGRLMAEMQAGGPVAAIGVCRDEAQLISAAVARETGIALGRTGHRLRNPQNAPREWVRPYVEAAEGRRAADVAAVAVDLGDRVGILRPIPTAALCLSCHGAPESFGTELGDLLRSAYPEDRAVGFSEGDLRGYFWAEVPRR